MKRYYIHFRTVFITVLMTIAIMLVLLYAPSPFVVTKPGIAVSTDHYISLTDDGFEPLELDQQAPTETGAADTDKGQLLLTAVMLETPNIWHSLGAMFRPSHEVKLKRDVLGNATIEEYAAAVTTMMQDSHHNALEAAYRYLAVPYTIEPQQIIVQQAHQQLLSESAIQNGDKIIAGVDAEGQQTNLKSVTQLAQWLREEAEKLQMKQASDIAQAEKVQASIIVERNQEQHKVELDLAKLDVLLPDEQLAVKGLNVVSFMELRAVMPEDERLKLEIATDDIGGPSAGLVLALTIIDKLTEGDLTRGKQIAATGTIDAAGRVGLIGGVVQKVYTTSKQGAHLFIVPKGNEKEARRTVKRIGGDMQIAGVSSLEEAIEVIASFNG